MSNTVSGKTKGSRRGISLIEMAVFISLMSVMMVGGSKVYDVKQSYDRQQVTVNNLNIIKDRLEKFKTANGRLPCVAAPGAKPGSANFGKSISSNCVTTANVDGTRDVTNTSTLKKARIGTIPTRELGLPDAAMIDGWGNRIVYAVSEAYATGTTPDQSEPGAISLVDADSNDNLTSGDNNVIYTVFSPGTDRRGAYNINGEQIESCDASSLAGRNCQGAKAEFVVSSKKNFGGDASKKLTSLFVYGAKTAVAAGLDTSGSTSVQEVVNGCTPVPEADTQACPTTKAGAPAYATTPIGSWVITRTNPCPTGTPPTAWSTALNTCNVTGTSAPTYTSCETINPGGGAVLVSGQVSTVNTYDGTTETTNVTNDCVWCYASSETQSVSCPASNGPGTTLIGGNIGQKRDYTCPAQSWGGWYDTSNTCSYCTPTSETQTVTCPTVAGQVNTGGSLTQKRDYTCPAQAFGGWADTANTCTYAAACSASSETRTVTDQCGSGYTGSKNQQRDYTCSTSTSGSWGSWYDTADNCTVACAATSETRTVTDQCQSGYSGSKNQKRDYTCSTSTSGSWGSWYDTADNCTATCSAGTLVCRYGYDTTYGPEPDIFQTTTITSGIDALIASSSARMAKCSEVFGSGSGGVYGPLEGTATKNCSAPACTPTSETRSKSCGSGMVGSTNEQRDYTCSGGTGTWGSWYSVSGPGAWETFTEAQHTSTTPEANYLFLGGPNPNAGYELGDCTALKREWNTSSISTAYGIIDPQFASTFGTHFDQGALFVDTNNPGKVYQSSHINGVSGGYVPWLQGTNGVDEYTYCKNRRQTTASCVAQCNPTSEARTVTDECPSGYSGSKTQTRNYTCSGGTGTWGSWTTTADNCVAGNSCSESCTVTLHKASSWNQFNYTNVDSTCDPSLFNSYNGSSMSSSTPPSVVSGVTVNSFNQDNYYNIDWTDAWSNNQSEVFAQYSLNYSKSSGTCTNTPTCTPAGSCQVTRKYDTVYASESYDYSNCPSGLQDGSNSNYSIYLTTGTNHDMENSGDCASGHCATNEFTVYYCSPDTTAPTCIPSTETRNVPCPSGYTGSHTQSHNYTCSGGTGTWGSWVDTSNTCTAPSGPDCSGWTPAENGGVENENGATYRFCTVVYQFEGGMNGPANPVLTNCPFGFSHITDRSTYNVQSTSSEYYIDDTVNGNHTFSWTLPGGYAANNVPGYYDSGVSDTAGDGDAFGMNNIIQYYIAYGKAGCGAPAGPGYYWNYSYWNMDECDACMCGGMMNREADCMQNGSPVSNSLCQSNIGSPDSTQESCAPCWENGHQVCQ